MTVNTNPDNIFKGERIIADMNEKNSTATIRRVLSKPKNDLSDVEPVPIDKEKLNIDEVYRHDHVFRSESKRDMLE